MSSKLDAYNKIKTAIEGIKTGNDNTIKTVGLWNNQFDNEDKEYAFNFPACFVEFQNIRWDFRNYTPPRGGPAAAATRGEQKGAGEEPSIITIHIGFSELEDGKNILEVIDPTIDAVYYAVHGLEGDLFSPILRIEERQDTDHDRVIDWQMDFTTSLSQCGEAQAGLRRIDKNTLTLETTKDLDIDDLKIRTGDNTV